MPIDWPYCGCDVTGHEPVPVEDVEDGERVPSGRFCNDACLVQHIEVAGLQTGTDCRLDAT